METKQIYTYCDGCGKKLIAYEEDESEITRHCRRCIKRISGGKQ